MHRWRRVLLFGLIGVLVLALGAAAFQLTNTNSWPWSTKSSSLTGNQFRVNYPSDWKQVSPSSVVPGSDALAALKQNSGSGIMLFQRQGSAAISGSTYITGLDQHLRSVTPDYKAVGWRIITLGPNKVQALIFTYERTKKHELDTVTVIPVGDHSFEIASAASEAKPQVSKEIGQIISSFTLVS